MTDQQAAVVIGVGNEFRRDDAVGPVVVARLRDRAPASVAMLVSDGEPIRLLEAWTGASLAVLVDAVSGTQAGRLHRIVVAGPDLDQDAPQSGQGPITAAEAKASSHGLGLGTAIGLGRALDRMPGTLIVHGIEAVDFSQGHGLSPAVAAGISRLTDAVLADIMRWCASPARPHRGTPGLRR